MIHVGASGGVLLLVPMSSSTITKTYSQFAAAALTRSPMRSLMKLAVFAYQAPSRRLALGRNAGQVALRAPSAWYCTGCKGFCRTYSSVSPSAGKDSRKAQKSVISRIAPLF